MNVASVSFNLAYPANRTDLLFGNPNIQKLGYFWFRYGTQNGPLHWINFSKQIFFPENPSATGFGCYLNKGVSGTFVPQTINSFLPPSTVVAGQAINLVKGYFSPNRI